MAVAKRQQSALEAAKKAYQWRDVGAHRSRRIYSNADGSIFSSVARITRAFGIARISHGSAAFKMLRAQRSRTALVVGIAARMLRLRNIAAIMRVNKSIMARGALPLGASTCSAAGSDVNGGMTTA
jgi:hypothetical protein